MRKGAVLLGDTEPPTYGTPSISSLAANIVPDMLNLEIASRSPTQPDRTITPPDLKAFIVAKHPAHV